jgi:hypothetical protein
MKNTQHIKPNYAFGHSMDQANQQGRVPKYKMLTGSVTGKYPVVLDDGRTIIYVTDKSREEEVRSKYALRK